MTTAGRESNGIMATILRRPVGVVLVHISLFLFGLMGWWMLPACKIPDVEFPTVVVTGTYQGADPQTMALSVASPLEAQLCGIPGLLDCSTSCVQGTATVTLRFRPEISISAAMGDIGRAIRAAAPDLPADMPDIPKFAKYNPADTPVMYITVESETVPVATLTSMASRVLADRLNSLPGVARVEVSGSGNPTWRVELDALALAQRGLSLDRVSNTVANQRSLLPWGLLAGPERDLILEGSGPVGAEGIDLQSIAMPSIPRISASADGFRKGWLSDAASSQLLPPDSYHGSWHRNHPCVVLAIYRDLGSNAVVLASNARKVVEQASLLLPAEVKCEILYDNTISLKESINDLLLTLFISMVLVVFVINLYLRSIAATLVACSVLPVCIVSMLGVMWVMGFTMNNLTLLALNLAVGFVVDDAVVVLENMIRHIEMGKGVVQASIDSAHEIGFTILAITVSLMAVFLPLLLMQGMLGRIFREFAITLLACIAMSGLVSLFLVPVLARWLLTSGGGIRSGLSNHAGAMPREGWYGSVLAWFLHRPIFGVTILGMCAVGTVFLLGKVRTGFLPDEDRSMLLVFMRAEDQISWDRMTALHRDILREMESIPEIDDVITTLGANVINTGQADGFMFLKFKPLPRRSLNDIAADIVAIPDRVPGLKLFTFNPPAFYLNTKQTKSAYQVLLTSQQAERLPGLVADITSWMRSQKEFVGIDSESESALPELVAGIDRRTLARLGGNVKKVDTTLQSGFGPRQIGFLGSTNETRGLSVGLMEKWRKDESSFPLLGLDVGSWGSSGRLDEVLSWNTTTVSRQVERYNRLPASTISFNIVKGADSGKALKMLSQKLDEVSNGPDQARLAGVAKEIAESIARTGPMVLLALLVMYLVLGVLYESLIHPFTVLVGLPSALLGGLFALWITELELDIYGFMGLLMLMGIVKKNAIMLVDFAQQLQSTGVGPEQAILEASRERLRPIQMTTLAAAAGALPLIAGIGSGSHALRPVGVILLGGLLCSQVVTLVLTPSVYRFMDRTFIRKRRKVIT